MEKEAQNRDVFSNLGFVLTICASPENSDKNKFFRIAHRHTSLTHDTIPCTTATFVAGQQEDCDHAGLATVDDEAVVAEAALGGRDGAAQRWATTWRGGWFCDSSSCICLLTSLELRVICAFSVGSV